MGSISNRDLTSRRVWRSMPVANPAKKVGAMIVTVFRSRLMPGVREEYVGLVERMAALAATMPGYISHKGFFADDGERVTIVEFESEEAQRAWRMHPQHREAQRNARDRYYSAYSIQVCQVLRANDFSRQEVAPAAE
jgi:heme-degrading monooxygenase HmoA